MEDDGKKIRILRSGNIFEVFTYDKLPTGKREKEKVLNRDGEEIIFPDVEYIWEDDFFTDSMGRILVGDKIHFLPKGWMIQESRRKEYVKTSNYRSREKIRRLASSNFHDGDTFMTLTFAENIQDLDKAHDELKKFLKRLRYKYGAEIPYLGVIEFQDKNKRGAIHYHCLVGMDLGIDYDDDEVREQAERDMGVIWGNGWVDLQSIKGVDNLGAYLVKYLTKDLGDERLAGRKHYVLSKGLKHPELMQDTTVVLGSLEGHFPTYTNRYKTEFCGEIFYREYNLKRGLER